MSSQSFYYQKKILLAVTGSIAAYKAAKIVRELVKAGAQVKVALTPAAQEFITAKTLAVLSQQDPLIDDSQDNSAAIPHIHWARWADFLMVIPASANTVSKLAQGQADNLVTQLALATPAAKVLAPAMNDQMLHNPATQRNLQQLTEDGWLIVEPEEGFLAEGYRAQGRLPDAIPLLKQIALRSLRKEASQSWQGKKMVITAGGTQEALDPVRYLGNYSSGKMGLALAQAASEAGAQVVLITSIASSPIYGVRTQIVHSAQEMLTAVTAEFATAQVFISAAAVADFRPATRQAQKIKKTPGQKTYTLELETNPDIVAEMAQTKCSGQIVVGFAAETENLVKNAQKKLARKQLDYLIANDVSDSQIGFGSDENAVTIFQAQQAPKVLPRAAKLTIAREIIAHLTPALTSKTEA
ncbi:bifunctional phosphopantothenoylcysteine decarboxylase/phosphopantothenate--cysteine ligase CoaBC [Lactobacillus sp. DCY120]|uniref:Coenzyme A biosynthesis bifunctional protein CoaBC n=1 Tax=Bombilactobacillus apium TaxID=2675299 RepID=A0A850R5P5_9LACO|nr:bifunctional phosphopantothenoylcysteine decarboxylase/phosphopantothenate--cysteine ligase CoaBC [Bombilactobacillus apium]NVY96167.1 bifunctional phosphopantothenoylcysteine decarboxylase/phosphopantothenate--cysteine ligase CoaBC [Bombilactobacillus apium]